MFLGLFSYSDSFTQVLDDNCIFIEPEDTTGIRLDTISYSPEQNFPNWVTTPFLLNGKRKYGSAMGNKMEIVINESTFKNYYTSDYILPPYNTYNGIDTKSMKEYAKEKFRKDVLEKFLKDDIPCTESNDYYVFSFITKKDCFKERKCRIKMGAYSCCSNDTNNVQQNLPDGYGLEIINGEKFLNITRKVPCDERSCCEERFHYVCNPNATEPNNSWVFSYKDFTSYSGTECTPQVNLNNQCPMNNPSTCKSGCGE